MAAHVVLDLLDEGFRAVGEDAEMFRDPEHHAVQTAGGRPCAHLRKLRSGSQSLPQ